MTNLTPNHDLFVDVLAHIEAHPEQWNQGRWYSRTECGTAACFAGWTCLLAGLDINEYERVALPDGTHQSVPSIAAELLGIPLTHALVNADEPGSLFFARNQLDDLYRHSARHLGVDIQVLKDKVRDRARA